jgi:hypothetical protein
MKFRITFFFLLAFCSAFLTAQVANQPNDLEVCDDASDGDDTNGFVQSFVLNVQDAVILGSQSPADYTVSYDTTQTDADNDTNPIDSSNPYANSTPNTQTIFARVTDNNNNGNFDTTSFNLIVNDLPTIMAAVELQQCDVDTDGFTTFNLLEARQLISVKFCQRDF